MDDYANRNLETIPLKVATTKVIAQHLIEVKKEYCDFMPYPSEDEGMGLTPWSRRRNPYWTVGGIPEDVSKVRKEQRGETPLREHTEDAKMLPEHKRPSRDH
ncbi:hypothetical protein NDU88_004483 [Pleurodeles waltl]|uniref:Uncharacterized protein n=1 Tax=Pleurodeles waltl TaxID=8319 RepID=A0AAV7W541_PLEWA|nr:hypothetical protein NDU88_004483 [Pleurodeles waltl]